MDDTRIALLLVDIQRAFWQPIKTLEQFASFPANVAALLATARAKGLVIVHLRAEFQADGSDWLPFYRPRGEIPCIAGSDGAVIENFAAPQGGEPIVCKQSFDGFLAPDLERILRQRDIQAVLLAGLDTSVCVLFTATSAYQRGFVPIIVRDACADEPEKHEAALRLYDGLCFQTVTTAAVQHDWPAAVRLAAQYAERERP